MISPRWKKILSDLWGSKVRTLLVAMSIAVGVFAVGLVSSGYLVMREDIQADFSSANPHSGLMAVSLVDDNLLAVLRRTEGVAEIEGRSQSGAQVLIPGGQKVQIQFSAIPGLEQRKLDQLKLLQGSSSLRNKEVYIDQGSFAALGAKAGDTITVTLQDGRTRNLRVAGEVHDVYANAFSVSRTISTYVTADTIEWLGGTRLYSMLVFSTKDGPATDTFGREVASRLTDKIKKSGGQVYATVVFKPGIHPAQNQIDAVLGLMAAMGFLAVFLSTFLVINTISALLTQQVRQIGIMKAIGGDFWQITGIYLVLILLFGVLALIIAVPSSGLSGYLLAGQVIALLNSGLGPPRIPALSIWLMAAVGLGVPLLAGLVPVFGAARMTAREAMSNYGLSTGGKRGFFDRILESVEILPRPLLISLRNTFRRKGRLALTLFTLMLGGAIFMGVFNVRDSIYVAIEQLFGYILSDVNVDFNHGYRMDHIRDVAKDVPGVRKIEGWSGSMGSAIKPDGHTSDEIMIMAPPGGSQLIKPVLTAGRWLLPDDENAVVVGNHFIKLRPDVKVGDLLTIHIGQKDYPFRVVGIYSMAGTVIPPVLYMNAEYLSKALNQVGLVYSIRVLTDRHDQAAQTQVAKELEKRFKEAGLAVGGVVTGQEIITQQSVTIDIIIYLLLGMAVLIAVVGGLGLMGTMSMNVLERTREIGVMRSIGAVDSAIMRLVLVEGMVIGVISWAFGAVMSLPITQALDTLVGVSLLNVPLEYTFSPDGLALWVVIVIALSVVACILPARNAVRLTVRDVLAYE